MMIKAYVFLITMLLPSGEMVTESSVHNQCPDKEEITEIYSAKQTDGKVVDWQAGCFEVHLRTYVNT